MQPRSHPACHHHIVPPVNTVQIIPLCQVRTCGYVHGLHNKRLQLLHLRHDSVRITDKRVKIINEVISGIRVIKMYAWEHAFKKKITQLRR